MRQACEHPDIVLIERGFPRIREYLLIDNRQPCGYDRGIPEGGLAIFHIDEIANNVNGSPFQVGWPANKNHYRVALIQADGKYDLERGINKGDAHDLFRAGYIDYIGPEGTRSSSFPNTNSYRNGKVRHTGIIISNIGASGSTMIFDVAFLNSPTVQPTTASPTTLLDLPFSSDESPSSSPIDIPSRSPIETPSRPPIEILSIFPTSIPSASRSTESPTQSPMTLLTKAPFITQSTTEHPTSSPLVSPSKAPVVTQDFVTLPTSFPILTVTNTKTPTISPVISSFVCADSPLRVRIVENGRRVTRTCDWGKSSLHQHFSSI